MPTNPRRCRGSFDFANILVSNPPLPTSSCKLARLPRFANSNWRDRRRWPRGLCVRLGTNAVVTVAILAQGTSWAVAVTQAFLFVRSMPGGRCRTFALRRVSRSLDALPESRSMQTALGAPAAPVAFLCKQASGRMTADFAKFER